MQESVRGSPPPDKKVAEMNFVFACVWAFGGCMLVDKVSDYRTQFSKWWTSEWKTIAFPEKVPSAYALPVWHASTPFTTEYIITKFAWPHGAPWVFCGQEFSSKSELELMCIRLEFACLGSTACRQRQLCFHLRHDCSLPGLVCSAA